jgi:IclR family transcriptional regulator, acetate operon repressor
MSPHASSSSASPAVGHALDILVRLAQRPGPVQASALARDLGVPRSSVYHILSVLVDRGFVAHVPDEHAYGLGVSSFEIGTAYLRHEPLERIARPILHRLSLQLGQTVHLGILHGPETVYLLKERPASGATGDESLVTDVGVRLPAHLTANGRAILAHTGAAQLRALFPRRADFITRTGRGPRSLPELARELGAGRERGWHGEVELVSEGLRSVGVPAFDHTGRPVAALSTTWHRHRERRDPETLAAILKVGADRLSERMSGGASVIPLRSA